MHKKPILITLITLVLLAAVASQAESFKKFQRLDANADGYLSRTEAGRDPALIKHWRDLDKNRDHKLDSAEFCAFETTCGNGSTLPSKPDTSRA